MSSQLRKPASRGGKLLQGGGQRAAHATATSEIPDKLYFRIGEVARLCSVQTFVLRFWEGEFSQLKPTKSGTGQRLYRKRDVEMALKIRHLLYEEGYTIAGARQAILVDGRQAAGSPAVQEKQPNLPLESGRAAALKVQRLRTELREILGLLSTPVARPRLVSKEKPLEIKPLLFE